MSGFINYCNYALKYIYITVKKEGYKMVFPVGSGLLNTKKLGITCIILTISCKTSVNVLNILKPYM